MKSVSMKIIIVHSYRITHRFKGWYLIEISKTLNIQKRRDVDASRMEERPHTLLFWCRRELRENSKRNTREMRGVWFGAVLPHQNQLADSPNCISIFVFFAEFAFSHKLKIANIFNKIISWCGQAYTLERTHTMARYHKINQTVYLEETIRCYIKSPLLFGQPNVVFYKNKPLFVAAVLSSMTMCEKPLKKKRHRWCKKRDEMDWPLWIIYVNIFIRRSGTLEAHKQIKYM